MSGPAIEARSLAKVYRRFLHKNQFKTLKSALVTGSLLSDLRPDQMFTALDDVSFDIPRGSTFGVIGANGSGKSTLLKLLAGITKPTRGTLAVHGRVSALIELGAGFHPEISGRENVVINGIMLGLSRRQIEERFDDIVAFSELEAFIDAPVKTYSSGMYMRLGFSVAIHVEPEILLIDEVLAVGDEGFTRKCLDKIAEFRRAGKTIVLVTHSLGLVETMCDEALWLRHGRVAGRGDPARVIGDYLTRVAASEDAQLAAAQGERALAGAPAAETPPPPAEATAPGHHYQPGRWGSRAVELVRVRLLDASGHERHVYVPGESLTVVLDVKVVAPVKDFVFGIGLFGAEGTHIYGTNTHIESWRPRRLDGAAEVRLTFDGLQLVEGTYFLDVAVHQRDGTPYDYHRGLYSFRIKSRIKDAGLHRPEHRWAFTGAITLVPPEPRPELSLSDDAVPGEPA